MTKTLSILSLLVILVFSIKAQDTTKTKGYWVQTTVLNGDTIPYIGHEPILVISTYIFQHQRDQKQYDRLVKYVKKVYPYAKLCERKLDEYNKILANVHDEQQRKRIMKQAEKQIKDDFEGDIRNLTFTQGKILLKLIDRQTHQTSYELLKDYRGSVRAIFWQSVARLFGANLKSEYDPERDDKQIENIVLMIEKGKI